MSSSLEEMFEAAAEKARITNGVSNDNKGKLYGLYKQATEGPMDESIPRPGFLNPVARAKYDAWIALKDVSKEQAMKDYIALVESL